MLFFIQFVTLRHFGLMRFNGLECSWAQCTEWTVRLGVNTQKHSTHITQDYECTSPPETPIQP